MSISTNILSFPSEHIFWHTLLGTGSCSSHCRIWHSLVSLTRRQSELLLVTRLEMPIPHVVEHSVHSVVCGKQLFSSNTSDMGNDTISAGEPIKNKGTSYNQKMYPINHLGIIMFLLKKKSHLYINAAKKMNRDEFGNPTTFMILQMPAQSCSKEPSKSVGTLVIIFTESVPSHARCD